MTGISGPQFVDHVVQGAELALYLNGQVVRDTERKTAYRPESARLIGIYQEEVHDPAYGQTYKVYRVVWERT